ncbi:hypothetical protein ASE00_09970 [Sphingomonas sp. Root710]|nr:hypothetical protein ASE00_09970 [Sphingomonas sp. Root710]
MVTFNVDLFLTKIRNRQILQTLPGAINLVSNAGATIAKGIDLSIKARPVAALRLTGDDARSAGAASLLRRLISQAVKPATI